MQSQQMTERIDSRMHLRSLATLGSVITGATARGRRRLQGATIQDHGGGLAFTLGILTQQNPQVFDHRLEAPSIDPAPHLLINHLPGRKIVRQHPPMAPGLGDISQSVEHSPQWILTLLRVLPAKSQIRRYKSPLFIRYIRLIPATI